MIEQWKPVEGFGDYQISSAGRLINSLTGKELNGTVNEKGYVRVSVRNSYEVKMYLLHVLVALHFIDNPENKPTVNHKDGNKKNNDISNLEWATFKEQKEHAVKLKLHAYGERIKTAKLTDAQILHIWKNNYTATQIVKEFNISFVHACRIANKKTRKHLLEENI